MAADPPVPPVHAPLAGFPSSRGLVSQKELLSLCDVGHWDPERGKGRSAVNGFDSSRLPPPNCLLANLSRACSPAPRGGHGRHWAPQPRPWRQQQSSKVRAGPARGPAHMPSSPRWPQHTSRRSGARSAEEDPASGRSPKQGPPSPAPIHPRGNGGPGPPRGTQGSGEPKMTLALTGRALGALAVAA